MNPIDAYTKTGGSQHRYHILLILVCLSIKNLTVILDNISWQKHNIRVSLQFTKDDSIKESANEYFGEFWDASFICIIRGYLNGVGSII